MGRLTSLSAANGGTFYTSVPYIGAVRDAADTRFQGWTCGLYSTTPACTAVPAIPTT